MVGAAIESTPGSETAVIDTADAATLPAALDAALTDLRGRVEAGREVVPADAVLLGRAVGERHWLLARRAADLAHVSHWATLGWLRGVVAAARAVGADRAWASASASASAQLRFLLDLCAAELEDAARGATGLSFPEPSGRSDRDPLRVIVTGFDPFNLADVDAPPRHGDWNPSGAAVLALDGAEITGPGGARALVRSLVLPVDRLAFGGVGVDGVDGVGVDGVVERYVRPHAGEVDAVLTVSLDRHLGRADAARLERFAVSTRGLDHGRRLVRVPGAGAPLLEASGPVDAVAARTAGRSRGSGRVGGVRVPAPVVRNEITLRLADRPAAVRLRRRLGLPASASAPAPDSVSDSGGGGDEVLIDDVRTVRSIAASARHVDGSTASVEFRLGGETFSAELVKGPGGNFLSNEVSYRVIRLLTRTGGQNPGRAPGRRPVSFHTHIPGSGNLDTRSADLGRPAATREAYAQRAYAIAILRRVVAAVATEVAVRRRSHRPST
jgi:hypothetical protein